MNTQTGKMHVIRDIATVRQVLVITERFAAAVRDFPCGHKPNGVGGKCDACEALKEWDALCGRNAVACIERDLKAVRELASKLEAAQKAIKSLLQCDHGTHEIPTADWKALRAVV